MKRRDQGISNAWSFLLGFVLLTLVVPGVLIGPAHAVRLIFSAVTSTVLQHGDPTAVITEPTHALPVIELRAKDGEIVKNGVHFDVQVGGTDANGVAVIAPSTDGSPFPPFEHFGLAPPRSADLLGGRLAIWIAGRMGVPVAYKEIVFLRRDGRDAGIHEVTESITPAFEQYRNIHEGPVAVLQMTPEAAYDPEVDAWKSADNWIYADDDEAAMELFTELLGVLNDTLITMADRRAAIDRLVDVDAFNRYHAALQMLGTDKASGIRMAIVFNPRTEKFYPVLIDALLVPAGSDVILTGERDLMAERMMAISDWRNERDRYVRQAIDELHTSGAFLQRLDALSAEVSPSLTSAGRTRRPLFSLNDPGFSAAALQWSSGDLRNRASTYWDRLVPVLQTVGAPANTITP